MMLRKLCSELMTNLNKTNLNKPLKFTLENEEILLHIMAETKKVHQSQLEATKHQIEIQHEMLATMTDMASALVHLANKFPEIRPDDLGL